MTKTRFCIVRHGETDWNVQKRLQGQLDVGLNAAGEKQAQAVREGLRDLKFSAAYSSDLSRAWQTALLATAGRSITVSPAPTLRERHYGDYQGLTGDEAARKFAATHHLHLGRNLDYDYVSGESLRVFADRVMSGLEAMSQKHAGQNLLLFTHGGVLDVIYRHAVGRALELPRDFPIPNAAINWVSHQLGQPKSWQVIDWADRRHLDATLDELVG